MKITVGGVHGPIGITEQVHQKHGVEMQMKISSLEEEQSEKTVENIFTVMLSRLTLLSH